MNDAFKRELEVFGAAVKLSDPGARQQFLIESCAGDEDLLQRVNALLHANLEAGTFLQSPPSELRTVLSDAVRSIDDPTTGLSEKPGQRIGRYKLLQQIGEGGMGVVYMAEQEEPVRRRVALKIIKLGMDTRQVVARFEAERQALALMDHPNIAKVLDGGATETGRPYFVMELVQGVTITDFCDKTKLPARDRLKLFIQVCQAIQSAHQKGIIHRDIKPSNVLVTLHDGVPVPKVIDFGIAKATNQKLTEKTLFTNFATLIGTPAYMSPEQAEMSGLDIDTRTDIYALGVLLYALLTGTTPFPEKRLRSLGYGEMQRVILEEEPERPSTRLSTMENAERTLFARNCGEELASLNKLLRGDLDWIVMKCLEKDRQRRYETANGLASDIQRHLTNEPVIARPPSAAYRFQKLVKRNRAVSVGVAIVFLAVISAATLTSLALAQEKRARKAEQLANSAREAAKKQSRSEMIRAEAVSDFINRFFEDLIPELLTRGGQRSTVMLLQASERLASDMTSAPKVRAKLHFDIANAYSELMWDYKASYSNYRSAEQLASENRPSSTWLLEAVRVHRKMTEIWDTIDTEGARKLAEDTRSAIQLHTTTEAAASWVYAAVSEFMKQYGSPEMAEHYARESLQLIPLSGGQPGFQTPPHYPLSTLLELNGKQGDTQKIDQTSDTILSLLSSDTNTSNALGEDTMVLRSLWVGGWDVLSHSSLARKLEDQALNDETRRTLQALLGVATAKQGMWKAGLKDILESNGRQSLNPKLWQASYCLAALLGDTQLQQSLAVSGMAQFGSEADARVAILLSVPLLCAGVDAAFLPSLTNLVDKALAGNIDGVMYAKLPHALLEYRSGNMAKATSILNELLESGPLVMGNHYFIAYKPIALFLKSAIALKSGNLQVARHFYQTAMNYHSSALASPGFQYHGLHWLHACTAELLRREVATMLTQAEGKR